MPTIASIMYRPVDSAEPVPEIGFLRIALAEANLLEGQGIEHDAKATPLRNLNIMDALTLAELAAEGLPSSPGALGENIVLDGLDLRTLPPGTRLRLGKQAVVEITKPRTGCRRLTAMDARMPQCTDGRVGIMGQVLQTGTIRVGDGVEIVTA